MAYLGDSMKESEQINKILHSENVKQNYTAKSGETLLIELPKIPITRYTQFVELRKETHGDVNSFKEMSRNEAGEGTISPSEIRGKAIQSGTVNFTLKAVDRISGEEIPDVEPLNITLNIEE